MPPGRIGTAIVPAKTSCSLHLSSPLTRTRDFSGVGVNESMPQSLRPRGTHHFCTTRSDRLGFKSRSEKEFAAARKM